MADTFITAADLLKINDQNLADLEVSDLLQDAPMLARLFAQPSSNGTDHKYLKETGAPVVGFRDPNAGRDWDASADTLVTINLKILDATFGLDKAIAIAHQRGGPEGLIGREAPRHIRAAFYAAEKQIINGTGVDSDGFVGLSEASTLDALADAMVINGGGSSGALSSVYAIRTGENDCSVVLGQEGNLDWGESYEQAIDDGIGKKFPGIVTPILGWLGLQIGSAQSVARLCNLDGNTNTLDDDKLAALLNLAPESRPFNLLVMNKRSRMELQQSRTATNPTGMPAPFPESAFNVPIITTGGVTVAETVVS